MAGLALKAGGSGSSGGEVEWVGHLGPLVLFKPGSAEVCPPLQPGHIGVLIAVGRGTLSQAGRIVELDAGEWTLFSGCLVANLAGAFQMIYVPKGDFYEHGLCVGAMLLRRFGRAASINRIVFSMFCTIFDEGPSLPPEDRPDLAQACVHLLKRALSDARRPTSAKFVLHERIRDYIEWHIRDPQLSPERIAKALNCTPRNIHRAFVGEGETLSQFILRRRLERCRDDLQTEALKTRTVTEIAFSWGFNNAAHFSRVFRKQFGCAPSGCRTQALYRQSLVSIELGESSCNHNLGSEIAT